MAGNAGRPRFDDFTFDPASGELTREGRKVRLQRQPSRLLELLIARRGEVVTRDEIRQALWGADTHVDFERSLNFCVAKLRAALRDDAASPRFVETVPTRGYRFVAACETASREPKAESRERQADSRQPAAFRISWPLAAAATLAVLLLVGIGYAIQASRVQPPLPKVVVVP